MNWLLLRLACLCWVLGAFGLLRAVWLSVRDVPLESLTTLIGLFVAVVVILHVGFKSARLFGRAA